MRKYFVFSILFLLFSCKKSEEKYLTEAKNLMDQEKYEEAITLLNSAVDDHDNVSDFYNIRGVAFYQLKKYNEAISDFELSIQFDSSNYRPNYNMGNCFFEMQKYQNALIHYKKAIDLEPYSKDLYINLGNTYYELNDFTNAISNYKLAIQLDQSSYLANFNMARSLIEMDSVNQSIPFLQKCTQIDPKKGDAFYFLALTHYIAGEPDDYCTLYKTSINLGFKPGSDILKNACQ